MRSFSPLFLLGTLGVLSAAATSAIAAVDTSQWKCETCPFEKAGVSGALDAGIGIVSEKSARFGDFTGLSRKGGYLVFGAEARYRAEGGLWANAVVAGDTGSGAIEGGREGAYTLRLGYAEVPRHLSDNSMTPFLGVGSASLTLPAGYPAGSTTAMPLASTLQLVDVGTTRKRLDAGATFALTERWSSRVSLRHDVKDGLQRSSGSFYSTASQLAAPVDQTTDQFELSTTYSAARWHGTLAYQVSLFRNAVDALTWANPFTPVVAGATRGQLALAPDNQLHQIAGSAGYAYSPSIRFSADFAVGRLTQDEPFLVTTLNPVLAAGLPALPEASLQGKVDTFNGNFRVTLNPLDNLRVNASYSRDVRDNRTPSATFAAVATDMFASGTDTNTPFTFKQDRFKLNADYRGPGSLKISAGVEESDINRSNQAVTDTRESTLWGRFSVRASDKVWLAAKLEHVDRVNNGYGVATWVTPAENPLMRKFNVADRRRDGVRLRADFSLSEAVSLGVNGDLASDDYTHSPIGLTEARSAGFGTDLSFAVTDDISLHAFVQTDRVRSRQNGSQAYSVADWSGQTVDSADVGGIGVKQVKGKLELGGDLTVSRSRSDVRVDTGLTATPFPTATTALDSFKLYASYKLQDNLTLIGNYWYERYDAKDWRVDGVMPNTVPNLLSFGEQAPNYRVHMVRVAVRYRF